MDHAEAPFAEFAEGKRSERRLTGKRQRGVCREGTGVNRGRE